MRRQHNAAPARCNRSGAGTFGAGIFSPDTCVVKIQHYFAAERNETHEPRKIHRTGKGFSPIRANRGDPAESSATCAGTSAEGAGGGRTRPGGWPYQGKTGRGGGRANGG